MPIKKTSEADAADAAPEQETAPANEAAAEAPATETQPEAPAAEAQPEVPAAEPPVEAVTPQPETPSVPTVKNGASTEEAVAALGLGMADVLAFQTYGDRFVFVTRDGQKLIVAIEEAAA